MKLSAALPVFLGALTAPMTAHASSFLDDAHRGNQAIVALTTIVFILLSLALTSKRKMPESTRAEAPKPYQGNDAVASAVVQPKRAEFVPETQTAPVPQPQAAIIGTTAVDTKPQVAAEGPAPLPIAPKASLTFSTFAPINPKLEVLKYLAASCPEKTGLVAIPGVYRLSPNPTIGLIEGGSVSFKALFDLTVALEGQYPRVYLKSSTGDFMEPVRWDKAKGEAERLLIQMQNLKNVQTTSAV